MWSGRYFNELLNQTLFFTFLVIIRILLLIIVILILLNNTLRILITRIILLIILIMIVLNVFVPQTAIAAGFLTYLVFQDFSSSAH